MKTQTAITLPLFCQTGDSKQYYVIANETIFSLDFIGLTISGSLLSQTTFREVTFESCVFYGTYIEHCEFIGCNFKNCSFEFSKVHDCNFNASTLENCTWENTPARSTLFQNSFIDLESAVNATYYNSLVENCYITAPSEDEEQAELPTQSYAGPEVHAELELNETDFNNRILVSQSDNNLRLHGFINSLGPSYQ